MGRVLSIFVDESGRFQFPDTDSRFYILGLVLHDQSQPVDRYVADLQRAEDEIGLEGHCFHAGPLIRKEKGYEFMSRKWRGRILSRMMAFAQKVPFKYHCLDVDKKLIDNLGQIVERPKRQLVDFISGHRMDLFDVETVKVYYDCGQCPRFASAPTGRMPVGPVFLAFPTGKMPVGPVFLAFPTGKMPVGPVW